MPGLSIINAQVAGENRAEMNGAGVPYVSSAPLATAGKPSLMDLAYLLVALACGITITLLGILMVYEGLRLASMLLHL